VYIEGVKWSLDVSLIDKDLSSLFYAIVIDI